MLQGAHQHHVEREVEGDGPEGDAHRGCGVAAGEEGGGQHLKQHEAGQADGVGGERLGGEGDGGGVEGASAEQHVDDRDAHGDQGEGGRQGEDEGVGDRLVQGALGGGGVAAGFGDGDGAGELRQEGGADGDADDAEGKLVQAVGVIQD